MTKRRKDPPCTHQCTGYLYRVHTGDLQPGKGHASIYSCAAHLEVSRAWAARYAEPVYVEEVHQGDIRLTMKDVL